MGRAMCDTWLSVDYLSSNASVMNLLVISFDRFFSVTRPLTYRARRTTRKAALMIFSAWAISAIVWPPSIVAWPYIEGEITVPSNGCYVQVRYFIVSQCHFNFDRIIYCMGWRIPSLSKSHFLSHQLRHLAMQHSMKQLIKKIMASLDLRAAFDMVNIDLLLKKLKIILLINLKIRVLYNEFTIHQHSIITMRSKSYYLPTTFPGQPSNNSLNV